VELREAIEDGQFVVYFQPRVDMSTGATSSMEALVRWVHPTRGLLEPSEFIPFAEETGLIVGLGELILEKVCAQLAQWATHRQDLVPVSVNVSPRQFDDANIGRTLERYLRHYHVDAKLLEIELTESSMMGNRKDVAAVLSSIKRLGVRLLIDDFGSGYSSLSQLRRFDVDALKIDGIFTSELDETSGGKSLFKAIITMAHALGIRVVAEGVERREQMEILKSLRCDEIQGFYISKPLPPSETQPVESKWLFPSTA
jgi:EAL domain-containing protein (putative c-di-GMP-specific phosphodiesterase class I)